MKFPPCPSSNWEHHKEIINGFKELALVIYIYIDHDIEFPRNHCISKCFMISCSKAPGDPGGLAHSLNAKLRKAIGRWIRMSGSLFLGP